VRKNSGFSLSLKILEKCALLTTTATDDDGVKAIKSESRTIIIIGKVQG
jgi:hypothetical protein